MSLGINSAPPIALTLTCSIPLTSVEAPNNNNIDQHLCPPSALANASSSDGEDGKKGRTKKPIAKEAADKRAKKGTMGPSRAPAAVVAPSTATADSEKVLRQFSVTSSDNTGLRMKIAIPRSEATQKTAQGGNKATASGLSAAPRARGRPRKKIPVTSDSSSSNFSDSDSDEKVSPGKASTRSRNSQRTRNSNSLKSLRSSSMASTSSSDFDSFSGNGKRTSSSGRPKIRPTAASTPSMSKPPPPPRAPLPITSIPSSSTTPVKRRPGRPPKKPLTNPPAPSASHQPSRVKEVRLSLADGGSSTDNDAAIAINAAINRVFESGESDAELNLPGTTNTARPGGAGAPGPSSSSNQRKAAATAIASKAVHTPIQYTSSLLRDFVEKTQKLGQQQEMHVIVPDQTANSLPRESSATNGMAPTSQVDPITGVVRRKRGRPPKKAVLVPTTIVQQPPAPATAAAAAAPIKTDRLNSRLKLTIRDSPDSGILSVNQSPSQSPRMKKRAAEAGPSAGGGAQRAAPVANTMLLSLEKAMYPTERVLYPPRNIKRGRPPLNSSKAGGGTPEQPVRGRPGNKAKEGAAGGVDPIWRKIDINKKFHKPINGYKSDGGGAADRINQLTGGAAGLNDSAGFRGEGSSAVCSKVLAAQCGYASDYGSVRKSRQSGYRSDYSTRTGKSGYRSDYSVKGGGGGGGGCGYRSDCSVRHRKKLRRKRRPKSSISTAMGGVGGAIGAGGGGLDALVDGGLAASAYGADSCFHGIRAKATGFDEKDILQLAGLSLGNSSDDDSGSEVQIISKPPAEAKREPRKGHELGSSLRRPVIKFAGTSSHFAQFNRAKFERDFIMNYRALVAENRLEAERMNARINPPEEEEEEEEVKHRGKGASKKPETPKYNCFESFSNVLPIIELKSKRSAKSIRSRRSSAVSRCSSRSNRSMHHKHRRKRLKSKSESGSVNKLAEKLKLQLEQIIESFGKSCRLIDSGGATTGRAAKGQSTAAAVANQEAMGEAKSVRKEAAGRERDLKEAKAAAKRGMKKRKITENLDQSGGSVASGPKRRTKKAQEVQSPDDHKLPLKKRHYLLADGEKGPADSEGDSRGEKEPAAASPKVPGTPKGEGKNSHGTSDSLPPPPAPQNPISAAAAHTPKSKRSTAAAAVEQKKKLPSPAGAPRGRPPRGDNPLEEKLSPVPPPGVFEPTVDLELQIPLSTIMISGTGKGGLLQVVSNSSSRADKCLDSPSLKKKRKKINRTGFPTVRKKKKRMTPSIVPRTESPPALCATMPELKVEKCDRVPTDGEATSTFLERNDLKPRLAIVSLERLQEPEVLAKRASRARDSSAETTRSTRDGSKEFAQPGAVSSRSAAKKVKQEDAAAPTTTPPPAISNKKPAKRGRSKLESPPPPTPPLKMKNRRATSGERNQEVSLGGKKPAAAAAVIPERRISLLEEISPHKRQSIRNLAKTLMVAEQGGKGAAAEEAPEAVAAKKIEPRKRRMTVAVFLERPKAAPTPKPATPKPSTAPPAKVESPTAAKDIKPAPSASELEQDALPLDVEDPPLAAAAETPRTDTPSSELSDRSTTKKAGKWKKKKYLAAGLFSDYYKEDRKAATNAAATTGGGGGGSAKDEPIVAPVLLPPPPYCEKFFRQTELDFQLPHDLWWAHEHQKLPGRDTVASWNFKKIRTNVYIDVRPNPNTDLPSCTCKATSHCADDCLNRMVYTECNPDTCPSGDRCQNTKIQRHEFAAGIERFMTEKKGWGVRTRQAIRRAQFIIEYLGEVVTEREFKERMGTLYAKDTHHYCLHLDGDLVIDGQRMGSECRFVNHSCTPNCEVQKWSVNGLSRMCLFALRDIRPGEELTYDYNFALYNPSEGQPCKCDSADCRGVIGGKTQRVAKAVDPIVQGAKGAGGGGGGATTAGRNRKRQAKKNESQNQGKVRPPTPLFQVPTNKEMVVIRESHCFLMRNLMKVRKQKDVMPLFQETTSRPAPDSLASASASGSSSSRRSRAVRTPEELDEKTVQLGHVLQRICAGVMAITTEEGSAEPLHTRLAVPPKKKNPKYHELVEAPIDFHGISGNATQFAYKTVKAFDEDVQRVFANSLAVFPEDEATKAAVEALKKAYAASKAAEYKGLVELFSGDKELAKEFEPPAVAEANELELRLDPNEDIIRCICGLFKDEGLMIECAKCQVWQHAECTRADTEVESYLCERCEPRTVDLEITLDEYSDEGYQYYLSLLRGSLQIRQTDTVYVLRDIPMTPAADDPEKRVRKHTYETIGRIDYADCDIFRVERLWKDKDGRRFVFGHHYLRPHETYHEPTRKFYPNEVVRVPLYEVVPIELIIDRCWVLDPTTYCKGRPVDSVEEHVYICELRVDKGARLFSKISKNSNPVCTKSYAFKKFRQKVKISKSYAPHELKKAPSIAAAAAPTPVQSKAAAKKKKQDAPIPSRKNSPSIVQLRPPPPKTLQEKRQRLEATLSKLLNKQRAANANNPNATEIDVSYLLTGRGARMKGRATTTTSSLAT